MILHQQRQQPQDETTYLQYQQPQQSLPQPPMDGDHQTDTNNGLYLGSIYWKQQAQLAQVSRQTSTAHNYARTAAVSSRTPNGNATQQALTVSELAQQFIQEQQTQRQQQQQQPNSSGLTPIKGGGGRIANSNGGGFRSKKEHFEDEKQRRINEDINKQFWTAIDLSGQGLVGLTPKLFNYSFLQKLYLNHNKLMKVPAAIMKLHQLKELDLSDNLLTELPPELGLLFSLRCLYLFDNKLTSLPFEFGSLFQLDILGIEGNPFPDSIKDLMATEGTSGIIVDLRERAPVKYVSPSRQWLVLDDDATPMPSQTPVENKAPELKEDTKTETSETASITSSSNPNSFSVMNYNTLCDMYATAQIYGYTPSWALGWKYRSELLKGEIMNYEADIICLQEVDGNSFEKLWTPQLAEKGYKGLYWPKTRARTMSENDAKRVDGCATFYKTSVFKLVERQSIEYNSLALRKDDLKKTADIYNRVMNKAEIAIISVFEVITPGATQGQLLVVSNTHLHWDPQFKDVKLVQVALLFEELEKILEKYASQSTPEGMKYPKYTDAKSIPLVISGDFNSTTDSGVYQLFSQGKVSKQHEEMEGRTYGRFTEEGMSHKFSLKSAYADIGELPFTNYTPNFVEVIDYIFYSGSTLTVNGLLGPIDKEYAGKFVGFPNPHHPSDHIPLVSSFTFKKQKEPINKPTGPPKFGSSSRKT